MPISNVNRRKFISLTAATSLAAILASPGLALNDAQAKSLIDKAVADINKVISSGKSLDAMIKDFERIFVKYGDVDIIARSALGPDARALSKSQLKAYTKAFQGYISRKYGKRFNEFEGGKVEVVGARAVKSFYEVNSTVTLRGQAPFQVNFLVSDKSGRNKFFDMIIEGISLRLSEKAEIGAMLDRRKGDINLLIQDLKSAG
ncbi:MlaC/ttg2D family ABC transporter substrate-binding protein [Shimia marina]|uniref:ABC transporter periplasmic binding protein MlaC n=1 Tax=Shimia marina TaxID=321267 RepID=A0A0P1ELP1_9RHOB|nr:ABC transporter substrate-binding protein [Shimia marina]CUH51021.1 ABC transporter periplasmic binding protein MlaC [Shimia marina]SFD60112.1 phospholipid transport system substrate-binding protein [Shimia marina]